MHGHHGKRADVVRRYYGSQGQRLIAEAFISRVRRRLHEVLVNVKLDLALSINKEKVILRSCAPEVWGDIVYAFNMRPMVAVPKA